MSDGAIHAMADSGPVRTWAGQSIRVTEDSLQGYPGAE